MYRNIQSKTQPSNKCAFRETERIYKKRDLPVDYSDVVDLHHAEKYFDQVEQIATVEAPSDIADAYIPPGREVKVYALKQCPGAFVITNPFDPKVHRHFIREALSRYSRNHSNLELHWNIPSAGVYATFLKDPETPISSRIDSAKHVSAASLLKKMRWVEVGRKYDWNTKKYLDENLDFPNDLRVLSLQIFEIMAPLIAGVNEYRPESGIVNYYQLKDTLTAHVDNAELNMAAPLISLSFGHSCVFLIGSDDLDDKPTALRLNSGDILIMTGRSRFSYHGVPRIIEGSLPHWLCADSSDKVLNEYISTARININVRQVF